MTGKPLAEIITEANALARRFYAIPGYAVPEGYRFEQATHPHEVACWAMAGAACDRLLGTERDEVLDEGTA